MKLMAIQPGRAIVGWGSLCVITFPSFFSSPDAKLGDELTLAELT